MNSRHTLYNWKFRPCVRVSYLMPYSRASHTSRFHHRVRTGIRNISYKPHDCLINSTVYRYGFSGNNGARPWKSGCNPLSPLLALQSYKPRTYYLWSSSSRLRPSYIRQYFKQFHNSHYRYTCTGFRYSSNQRNRYSPHDHWFSHILVCFHQMNSIHSLICRY